MADEPRRSRLPNIFGNGDPQESKVPTWADEDARIRQAITDFETMSKSDKPASDAMGELTRTVLKTSSVIGLLLWHIYQENKFRDAKLAALSRQLADLKQGNTNRDAALKEIAASLAEISANLREIASKQSDWAEDLRDVLGETLSHMSDSLTDIRNFTGQMEGTVKRPDPDP